MTANARYLVSCQIPVPFSGVKKSVITFEAGPRRPGVSSFRTDFNPAKLSSSGLNDFLSLLDASIDADTTEFFRHGKVTRCDHSGGGGGGGFFFFFFFFFFFSFFFFFFARWKRHLQGDARVSR